MEAWSAPDDLCIRLIDETGEQRDDKTLSSMMGEVQTTVNKYNFDLSCWGGWQGMRVVALGEQQDLSKRHVPHNGALAVFQSTEHDGEFVFVLWAASIDEAHEEAQKIINAGRRALVCPQFYEYKDDQ